MVKKKLKTFCGKSFSVFKGASFKPFEHTMTSFSKMFFFYNFFSFTFIKNAFDTSSRFFDKSMHVIKKKGFFDHKVFKLQCSAKFF